jgi:hypothetical protein
MSLAETETEEETVKREKRIATALNLNHSRADSGISPITPISRVLGFGARFEFGRRLTLRPRPNITSYICRLNLPALETVAVFKVFLAFLTSFWPMFLKGL